METKLILYSSTYKSPYNENIINVSPLKLCLTYYDIETQRGVVTENKRIVNCKDISDLLDRDDTGILKNIIEYSHVLFGLYITISVLTIVFLLKYLYGNKKIYKSVAILLLLLIIGAFITLITFINISYIPNKDKSYFEFTSGSIMTIVMFCIMLLLLSYILSFKRPIGMAHASETCDV